MPTIHEYRDALGTALGLITKHGLAVNLAAKEPEDFERLKAARVIAAKPHDTTDAAPAAPQAPAPAMLAPGYEAAARAAGWQCDEGGPFHDSRGAANGTGDPVEYADDWKHACEISGIEPAPDASALMLAALRDVEMRLCDIWERRPEMRGEIAKSRDVVDAAIAAAEGWEG